jgi:hypothetical protein
MREGTPALSPTGFRPGRAGGLYPLAPIPDPMAAPVEIPTWLVAIIASALLGVGGAVGGWLRGFTGGLLRSGARADLEKLVSKIVEEELKPVVERIDKDLIGVSEKATASHSVAETANDQAEAALSIAQRVEQRMDFMEKQIVPRLDKMTDRLTEQGEALATQTATLVTFMEEMRRRI